MADQQYLFVNSRRLRTGCWSGASGRYRDLLARDRHPIAALFVEVPTAKSTSTSIRPRPRSGSAIRRPSGADRRRAEGRAGRSGASQRARASNLPAGAWQVSRSASSRPDRQRKRIRFILFRQDSGDPASRATIGDGVRAVRRAPNRQACPYLLPARRRTRAGSSDLYRRRSGGRTGDRRPACRA
jgi:DNA mismatch repair protein MutL